MNKALHHSYYQNKNQTFKQARAASPSFSLSKGRGSGTSLLNHIFNSYTSAMNKASHHSNYQNKNHMLEISETRKLHLIKLLHRGC
jgi:hypothetical protein